MNKEEEEEEEEVGKNKFCISCGEEKEKEGKEEEGLK